MSVVRFISLLFIICLFSCTGKKDNGIITFQLSKSDYVEKINVAGTVQAVINTPVMPPRNQIGQMTIVRLVQDGAFVKKGDTLCVLSSPEVESRYRELLTSIETLEAGLRKAEADIRLNTALLEAQLATSEAQLKISSLDSLQMKYATEVNQKLLELEMKKAVIEKQKTERKLAATKTIGEADIRQKRTSIMQEKMRAQTFADQISAMTIIAQRDGIVMRTESPRIMVSGSTGTGSFGGPVREGSVILLITPVLQFPDLSRMQVSADVAEADFRKIEKGQKAFITVDASEKLVTTGKINRKSLSSSVAQRYSGSKVKSYEVIIDVDSCHSKMKPGLSANCEIIIKEEKDTLFVPTIAIYERDSSKIVYVKGKKEFVPVKVETGTSGSSFTIITGGLKGDETIALTEPPNSLIVYETTGKDTIRKFNQK
ncbi:MAG: HlyD family efflux transporter periplasmic adaptor subunit [Bacteroidia bacterium]|jgi:HlyD family secretion protein|nr:HlyD family efflux transporter periplasmic adaptor subunit [Bacteroidia bacterium]